MSFALPPGVPLSEIPAAVPPPNQIPNFINPPTLESAVIGVCSVMIVLTLFFVMIRLHLNLHAGQKLGLDDYCCLVATVLSFSYIGMILSQLKLYRHSWDRPLSFYDAGFFKKSYAEDVLLGPSIFFAKTALLLLYLRIFGPKRSTRYWIYFGLGFAFCLYWINIPINSYYCAPSPGESWGDLSLGLKCRKSVILGLVQGSLNVVLDLFILALPIPVVMTLQMSKKRRMGVLAVFMTGILAVAASVLGLAFRVKLFLTDSGWDEAILYICIIIETDVAIICSSMPAFASFSKTYVANSKYLADLRSRLASRFGGSGSKTKLISKTAPFPRFGLSLNNRVDAHSDSFARLHDESQAEQVGRTHVYQAGGPSVHTKVHAVPRGDLEEGIIMESLSVEQSAHAVVRY